MQNKRVMYITSPLPPSEEDKVMQVFIVIMVGILQLTPAQLEQIQMCKDIGGTMYNSLESSCFKPSADNPDELTEYTLTETTEETDNAN